MGATAVTFSLCHLGWSKITPALPDKGTHRLESWPGLDWLGPGLPPIERQGSSDGAALMVLGDSRVRAGIDRRTLERAGLGASCIASANGSDLRDLLRYALGHPPEHAVVSISPHSLVPAKNQVVAEIMRSRPPALDRETATPEDVRSWHRAELEHLVGQGFPAAYCRQILGRLCADYYDAYDRGRWPQRRWHGRLERAWTEAQCRALYTVTVQPWNHSWFPRADPSASDRTYENALGHRRFPKRLEAAAAEAADLLAELSTTCPTIVVRLPVSPSLRAIEDAAVAPGRLAAIAESAGVRYFDFGTSARTRDGSHLTFQGAVEFTAELAGRLGERPGWVPLAMTE